MEEQPKGQVYVQEKSIVVPGQVLAEGMDYLPSTGAYREGDAIIATVVGLAYVDGRLIKIIPLGGQYMPKPGDMVIGKIVDMTFNNWFIDIGCANNAAMSLAEVEEYVEKGADLSAYYDFGEYVLVEVTKLTRSLIDVTMKGPGLRKLGPGRIIKIKSSKVPRVIGKQGSMISIIKEKTGCRILVGQNGIVWIQGNSQNQLLADEAIRMIEKNSHREGLTDHMAQFLEQEAKKRNLSLTPPQEEEQPRQEQRPSYRRDSFQREGGGFRRDNYRREGGFRREGGGFRRDNYRHDNYRRDNRPQGETYQPAPHGGSSQPRDNYQPAQQGANYAQSDNYQPAQQGANYAQSDNYQPAQQGANYAQSDRHQSGSQEDNYHRRPYEGSSSSGPYERERRRPDRLIPRGMRR